MDPLPAEKLTFRQSDLDHLSDDEKCMFMQAGIILTELRFYDLHLHSHIAYWRKKRKCHDAEIGILFSQITILLAGLAGKLVEANNAIKKSFYLPTVSKKYAPLLSPEASAALASIKTYFSDKNNIASTLRNNFGFHYDRDRILDYIGNLAPGWEHRAYLPRGINEAFLEFGQFISMNALFKSTGATNAIEGFYKVYGDLGISLVKDFIVFFHGVLQVIGKEITFRSEKVKIPRRADSPALYMPTGPGAPLP